MTTKELTQRQELEAKIADLDEKILTLTAKIEDLPVRREEANRLDLAELSEQHREWVAKGSPAYTKPANRHANRLALDKAVEHEDRQLRTLQTERAETAAQLKGLERGEHNRKLEEAQEKRDSIWAELEQLREEWREVDNEVHHHDRNINELETRELDF